MPLIFIVTTSLFQDWVICAPAAFRKSGSRLSGSLSGIEPLFSVTGYNHGSPLYYHRKLISQKFEWTIVASKSIRFVSIIMIHQLILSIYLTNKYRAPLASDSLSHVLALFSHSYPSTKADLQINYYWFNEPFAVSQVQSCLYLHVHGLIFETSIWLLAGSTRYLSFISIFSFLILSLFLSHNSWWDTREEQRRLGRWLIWLIEVIEMWSSLSLFLFFVQRRRRRLSFSFILPIDDFQSMLLVYWGLDLFHLFFSLSRLSQCWARGGGDQEVIQSIEDVKVNLLLFSCSFVSEQELEMMFRLYIGIPSWRRVK